MRALLARSIPPIAALAAAPTAGGGRRAPFIARWVTDTGLVFLQFDRAAAAA